MTTTLEYRSVVDAPEFRGAENGRSIRATGVAMRYGARSKPIVDPRRSGVAFREVHQPGTFTKSLSEQDVRSHLEHGGPYLGRTANATLRLVDDERTLSYELDLPDTAAGHDAAALLERQDVRGCSVGFSALPKSDVWTVDDDGMALRSVTQARLGVVDLTVAPCFDDSTAEMALRSLAIQRDMDVRSLLEAADRGELPTLIASPVEDDETVDRSEHGRETPTAPRLAMSALLY